MTSILSNCVNKNNSIRLTSYLIRGNATKSSTSSSTQSNKDDQFVQGPNPYTQEKEQCILCKHKIKLDYKNPRLLSQFVSPLTGQVYAKNITGLCLMQQTKLRREVNRSIHAMLMPKFYRNPKFNKDPALFNPERPKGKFP